MPKTNKNYAVGKGKPPTETRFKPGQSGNPSGRPKGARNFATLLAESLDEQVFVTEHGERKTMTKMEAMAKQLANKAASGDIRFLKLLLPIMEALEHRPNTETAPEPALTAADHDVMQQLYQRLRRWEVDDAEE